MHCDTCNKRLAEDDTYESVLCKSCMNSKEVLHCAKCCCILKLNKVFKKIRALASKQRKAFLVFGVLALIIACIFPFSHLIALKLFLGLIAIPMLVLWGVILTMVVFAMPHKVGSWINHKFDWGIPSFHDSPGGVFRWLIGIITIGAPMIFYVIGALVYRWFF